MSVSHIQIDTLPSKVPIAFSWGQDDSLAMVGASFSKSKSNEPP